MPAKIEPIAEISFASRVGFLPKGLWREFFKHGGLRWQNMLWRQFREQGIFWCKEKSPNLYFLNHKNPVVKKYVDVIARPPHVAQRGHDELVGRTLLLLEKALPLIAVFTERELKQELPIKAIGERFDKKRKHPDLVIEVRGDRIAVEIELSQKSRARYRDILRQYRAEGYSHIIYVIRSRATRTAIDAASVNASFPRDQIALGYVSEGDWRNDPLSTTIHFDDSTMTLAHLVGQRYFQDPSTPGRTLEGPKKKRI